MAKAKLLIVDDDPNACETLSDIFKEKGNSVATAGTGREAINKARQIEFDAALIDIRLPDIDGIELLKELKRVNPEIVCIIITGYAALQNAIDALKEGANGYFVKPLIIEEIILRVGDALEKQCLQRKLKESLEEIRQLNMDLERRVEERTSQLQDVIKELEAFSYSVSHDLRAPLRAINGFSNVLLEDHSDRLDNECKRLLNAIRSNANKMGELIDDLLALSRLGRKEIKKSEINMHKLANEVFDELKHTASGHMLQLNTNMIPYGRGDQAMIHEVFTNLLSNAIKFTKYREKAVIEVGGRVEKNQNTYYVRDNGVGFDMQYVGKLFGVFQRLHSSNDFEGTGVGLAIVQRIILRHGGKVWAEGKVGDGATFYFTLPGKEGVTG